MQTLSSCHGSCKPHGSWQQLNRLLLLIRVSLNFSSKDIGLSALLVLGFFVHKFLEFLSRSFIQTFGQGEVLKELLQIVFVESPQLKLQLWGGMELENLWFLDLSEVL